MIVFLKEFFEKVNFQKSADDNKSMKNYPAYKDLTLNARIKLLKKQRYVQTKLLLDQSDQELFVCFFPAIERIMPDHQSSQSVEDKSLDL